MTDDGSNLVPLRSDTLRAVDERARLTGLSRESVVNAILTAAFSFEEDEIGGIMRQRRSCHD
jgi:hypothetical protein